MKNLWRIIINVVIWAALVGYLVVASRYCTREKSEIVVRNVQVVVRDSAQQKVVTPAIVKRWLREEGFEFMNRGISDINTAQIEQAVETRGYVRDARVYTTLGGDIVIEVSQRRPIGRVSTAGGHDFYFTGDGFILPPQSHESMYVPVVTGSFTPPFARSYSGLLEAAVGEEQKNSDKNYIFLTKLINFVKFMESADFWRSEIVQINVVESPSGNGIAGLHEPMVEIVPRTGNHVALLGGLDGAPEKLDKLLSFYRGAVEYEGWDNFRYIDLRFRGQVVCTK